MSTTLDGSLVSTPGTQQALRTVTFKSVLHGTARLCGYKPSTRDLTPERAEMLTEFINERVREASEYSIWPELRWIEQRYYHQGLWSAGSYGAGNIVYHADSEAYYVAATGTSETPSSTATDWTVTTSYSKHIPWEQLNKTSIGQVERVFKSDPRVNRSPTELRFEVIDREGIYVLDNEAAVSVWLQLQVREPEFTSTANDTTATYSTGDRVYYPTTGEVYRSLADGNGDDDPSTSGNWDKEEFPYIFSSFVKRAAYADWLRTQGQHDLADKHETKAFQRLDDVLHANQVQQLPGTYVTTRGQTAVG